MWEQIKKWLQIGRGRYIIVEDNQPKFVIMDIAEYERLLGANPDAEINKELAGMEPTVEEEVLT